MKYLLNHTETILSVSKYLDISPGKYGSITDAEVESPEVVYAVRAKWATLHDKIPQEIAFEAPAIEFEAPAYEEDKLPDAVEVPAPVEEVAEEVAPVEVEKPKAARSKAKQ